MTPKNTSVVGTLCAHAERVIVRLEGTYDTDATDLWSALTAPDRLARWLSRVEGDLRLGGNFCAFVDDDDQRAVGTIVVCEPPRRLHVTWRFGDEEETLIAVELTADGDRTRLVLEERGVHGSQAAGYGAGWHAYVEALGAHLAGEQVADWRNRWTELLPAYRAQADALTDSITLCSVALECPDAGQLAAFYAEITGGKVTFVHDSWATVRCPGGRIDFQTAPRYSSPAWPDATSSMQMHLDFDVDDLDATEARVLAAGATKYTVQPNDHCRVYADPAGHPFCLSTQDVPEDALNRAVEVGTPSRRGGDG